jgi:hypothetical protein
VTRLLRPCQGHFITPLRCAVKLALQFLPRLFRQVRTILTRRIDRLVVQFKTSGPEFYNEYKVARKIVNPSRSQNGRTAANIVFVPDTNAASKAA